MQGVQSTNTPCATSAGSQGWTFVVQLNTTILYAMTVKQGLLSGMMSVSSMLSMQIKET